MNCNDGKKIFSLDGRKQMREAIIGTWGLGVNALSIVRALGRMGVPVHLIGPNLTRNLASRSKYCTTATELDPANSDEFARLVKKTADACNVRPILYADNDMVLQYLLNEPHLEQCVRLTSPLAQTRRLLDKKNQIDAAAEAGLPVPESWFPETWEDVAAIQSKTKKRLIAKKRFPIEGGRDKFKVLSADDAVSLTAQLRKNPLKPSELFVQEYISGLDTDVHFALCYRAVQRVQAAIVTGRKLIQSGSGDGGIMILGKAVHNPEVYDLSLKFMHSLACEGYFGVEFKYCRQERKYIFIEVNVRPERCNALARAAGIDLDVISYLDMDGQRDQLQMVGLRPKPAIWLDGKKILETLRRRRKWHDFRRLLGVLTQKKEWAVYAHDDLRPFLQSFRF